MRARLEPEDIVALRLGRLGFSQQESTRMRVSAWSARTRSDPELRNLRPLLNGPKDPRPLHSVTSGQQPPGCLAIGGTRHAQTTEAMLMCSHVAAGGSASSQPSPASMSPAARAFQFVEALAPQIDTSLRALRPAGIGPEQRRRVLTSLPAEGALQPNSSEATKLASSEIILAYHERHDVFETKVIDVPQAFIGLHGRAVLLISRPALRLLSSTELRALIAHEIGHDYFWEEYERARTRGEAATIQEVELKCDGIAVLTLLALELDPASLNDASRKLTRFNESLGATADAGEYPRLKEREHFAHKLVAMRADPKR
jgi:hypothetical protein